MDAKDAILNNLTMMDILDKYGIKHKGYMFHCCFHGEDKTPSAKCYKNSFYCFSCNRNGDLIQFVEYLFNIKFKEAIAKLINDFSLPIEIKTQYDRNKIIEYENRRKKELQIKEKERIDFIRLCKRKDLYKKIIKTWKKQITTENWEDMELAVSYLEDRVNLLDVYISQRYNLDY